MKWNKLDLRIILFLVLLLVVASGLLLTRISDNKLKIKHELTCATIIKIWVTKSGNNILYEFSYKGKMFSYNKDCSNQTMFEFFNKGRRQITVLFEKGNPDNNILLEKESDYIKYDISATDKSCYSD